MSWHGREVLRYMENAEREVAWWGRYAVRLTPAERKKIRRNGGYTAIVRPLRPAFTAGWLEVTPKLRVLVEDPEMRRGKWRTRIAGVQDFRAPSSMSPPGKRTRESLDGVTTLAGASGYTGEPERMEPDGNAQRARWRRASSVRDAIIGGR